MLRTVCIRGCECLFAFLSAVFTVCCIPRCDCGVHACVGTSYQYHECRYCSIFNFQKDFFFAVVSLVPWKTERWGNFHDCRFGSTSRWRVATSNSLLVTDWFWPFMNPIHHCPKQKPAWTLNILWGSMKKLCWYWLRGVWKRDLGNWVARGIGVESCCNFSYKYCFCIECLSFC